MFVKKESVGYFHKCLFTVCGSAAINRSTIDGQCKKEWWLPKQEKKSSMISLTQALPWQLLSPDVLQLADALLKRIIASQHSRWHVVFQSAKEVLLISSLIAHLKMYTWWAPQNLRVDYKTKSYAISSELLANFKAKGEPFLFHIVTADETWMHCINLRQKAVHGMAWAGILWDEKSQTVLVNFQGHACCLLVLWGSDSCGCDARRGDTQLWHVCQDIDRLGKLFKHFRPQESNIKLATTWQYKAAHNFKDSGIHHKIWLYSATSSTQQPQSIIPIFPPVLCPEERYMQYKVRDLWHCDSCSENLATWAGQGMVLKMHTHTKSSAQGHRSGWILYVIVDSGVKQSLFIVCNFYNLGINIYQ